MEKIFICGLTHSGKGLMRTLLDGHPELISCPIPAFGVGILSDRFQEFIQDQHNIGLAPLTQFEHRSTKKISYWIEGVENSVSVSNILNLILQTEFERLINASVNGVTRASRQQGGEIVVEFECDWLDVIRRIQMAITSLRDFDSPEIILDIIYDSFIKEWRNKKYPTTRPYRFVATTPNRIRTIECILERSSMSKIIVMIRDPAGRAFTNSKHMKNKFGGYDFENRFDEFSLASNSLWLNYDDALFSKPFILEMKEFRNRVSELKKNNDRLHIVKFDELINRKKDVMDGIAKFLGIAQSNSLYRASLNSAPLEDHTEQYSGHVADDAAAVLSSNQIGFIQFIDGQRDDQWTIFQKISYRILDTACGKYIAKILTLVNNGEKSPRKSGHRVK